MGGTYESAASDAGAAAPKPSNATRPHPSPGAGLSSAPAAPTSATPAPATPAPAASSAVSAAAWPSVRPAARSDGAQPGGPKAAAPADPAPPQPPSEPSSEPPPQRRIQDQMDRIRARERAKEKAAGAQKALATAPQPQQPQQPRHPQQPHQPKQPQRPPRLSDEDEAELARTAAAMNRTSDIQAFEPIARGALEAEPAKALRELHRLGEQLTDPRVRDQLDRMIEGALRPKAGAQARAARQAAPQPAAPQPAKPQPAAPQPAAPPTLAPDAKFVFTSAVEEEAEASGPDAPQSDWFDEATGKAAAWALDKAADVGRAVGLDHAADNLDHFLEGSGQDRTLTREEARTRGPVIEGERANQERFERYFTIDRTSDPESPKYNPQLEYRAHLLSMRDGDVVQLPKGPDDLGVPRDHWDRTTDRGDNLLRLDLDEALASGRSTVRSSAPNGFTATRTGDTITLHGKVVHDWSDAYDFHDGSDGWIGAPARDHGGAREFENTAEWRQTLTATFKIVDGELVPKEFVWRDLD